MLCSGNLRAVCTPAHPPRTHTSFTPSLRFQGICLHGRVHGLGEREDSRRQVCRFRPGRTTSVRVHAGQMVVPRAALLAVGEEVECFWFCVPSPAGRLQVQPQLASE